MNVENRRLYRSRSDRMISGVAGGLGEYLNIDATIVRLLFVFFALAGGPGLLVYIVMLLVVPEEPLDTPDSVVEVESEETSEE
ncbi:MAG: PspC domain-containing protein [Anaerolineales bacterium]|jgi:phage shock protein C